MRFSLFPLFLLAAAHILAAADYNSLLAKMDARAGHFGEVSRQIWEFAETGYREHKSAALLKAELQKAGFQIQDNVGGIPTAFVASWGQGKPVIGIMGEYDALPELSQDIVPQRKPRTNGAPGHGCGHNLLGAASAFAAISVKDHMAANRLSGSIRFYGTPAEEGGGGKIYMARAGVFHDVDAMITWHPGAASGAGLESSLANINAKFQFHGRAAHASATPQLGRSALDGLLLMNHAVEMLREHVPASTRIHYIITKGGAAPNIVPAFTEGYVYARSPAMPVLDDVWQRILKCAQAGALASETRVEVDLVNSVYNVLPNEPLARLFQTYLTSLGGVTYSPEERAFAESLRKTFPAEGLPPMGSEERIQPFQREGSLMSGSTDVADVSWLVPTAQFYAATYVPGTPGHSWQATACTGTSIGRKGMVLAAKVLALSALDLLTTPELVAKARADFDRRRGGHVYRSRVPADKKPPLNYRESP